MEKNMYSSSGATGSAPFPSPRPLQTPMDNMYFGCDSTISSSATLPHPTDIDEYDFSDLDPFMVNTNIDDCDDFHDLLDSFMENTNIDDLCDLEDLSNRTSCSAAQSASYPSASFQTESRLYIGANYDQGDINLCNSTSSNPAQSAHYSSEPLQTESRPYIGASYDQGDINLCNPTSSNPSALGANYDLSVQSNPLPPPPFRIGRPQPPSLPLPPTENTTFPSAPQATGGPIDMGSGSVCRAAGNCSVAGTWAPGWILQRALQEGKARSTVRRTLEQTMRNLGMLHGPLVSIERDLVTRDPGDSAVPRTHLTDSPVRKTCGGEWAEKKDGFKAFRDVDNRLEYVLAERTFQFKKTDPQNGGTNAVSRKKRNRTKEIDWEMKEYYLLRPHNNPGELFLEEDFAVRVISSTEKNAEGSSNDNEEAKSAGKRPRAAGPSHIWKHCIKIHTKDKNVVYALCKVCDKALRCEKHNTSTVSRHPCLLKHSQPSTITTTTTTTTEEAFLVGVKNVHISCP